MNSLQEYVQQIRIIDGHEHLATPAIRKKENTGIFGLLHYLDSDLITAGMPRDILSPRSKTSDEEKAAVFLKYWDRTNNTTYARMLKTALEDLYGFRDWSVQGILELDGKVKAASANDDWYRKVLNEQSGIDVAFTLIQTTEMNTELLRPIMFLDFAFKLRTLKDIQAVERSAAVTVHTLEDYLNAVDSLLYRYVQEGMVATKLGHAYWRSLACGKPTRFEAEQAFNRMMVGSLDEPLSQTDCLPLQDYLIHFIVRRSIAYELPIQIHTGHHETSVSGNGNIITNSRVTGLLPLLLEYPEAKFVLLHCGLPYQNEDLSLAKNFPNVYADFTWVYIISPTAAKQILSQMIEMVPGTKIQGFGGDYNFVEGTYAHQKLARQIAADVLQEKVREGSLNEREAMTFADRIFRDNLMELYRL